MKRRAKTLSVLTVAPAHSQAAIDELKTGVDDFIEWANRARTGATALPAAHHADEILTAISEGRVNIPFNGLAGWATLAADAILHLVQVGHWHLRTCTYCTRWLLPKDQRTDRNGRNVCRRLKCVREKKKAQKASERKARKNLDGGATAAARGLRKL